MRRLFFTIASSVFTSITYARPATTSPDPSALSAASSAALAIMSAIPAVILPTASSNPDDAEVYAKNAMKCVIWMPPRHDQSLQDCNYVCGDAFAKATQEQKTASISCIGNSKIWDIYDANNNITGGICSCNNALINELASDFVAALPALAEIGCNIIMGAVSLVIQAGALAIPGVGEAIDAGMIAGVSAAKLAAYAYDAGQLGGSAFSNWLSPCGTSHLPSELQTAFEAFNSVSGLVIPGGFKAPKNIKPGSGRAGDKGAPNAPTKPVETKAPPKKTTPTTTAPHTTKTPESTTSPKTTSSKPTSSCTKRKRAAGGSNNCDDTSLHVSVITSSIASLTTITKVCDGSFWPQACYHYYSAIQNYGPAKSLYTCSDENDRAKDLPVTDYWLSQHTAIEWKSYTTSTYTFRGRADVMPNCQRDEYPPAYFLPDGSLEQVVRWLPGSENGGAGSLWRAFCAANDGGHENGQLLDDGNGVRNGAPNEQLQRLKNPKEKEIKGADGKTTTTTMYDSTFSRAVFKMDFEWKNAALVPNKGNDWGLRANPCWPSYIAPDDPGYVLLTNDDYYKTAAKQAVLDQIDDNIYAKPPTGSRLLNGNLAWVQGNPGATGTKPPDIVKPPPGNQPVLPRQPVHDRYPDEEDDSTYMERRSLHLLGDGFGLQDFNTSRRLTPEEISDYIEITYCRDRKCTSERRALGDDANILIVEGKPLPSVPATNFDTIPTMAPEKSPMAD